LKRPVARLLAVPIEARRSAGDRSSNFGSGQMTSTLIEAFLSADATDQVDTMKALNLAVLTAAITAAPALADERRELGPHEHGHGTLNIAIEKTRLSMELEAPGMDIVGFEHAAEAPEQKSAVEKATALLDKPLGLFKLPQAAECKVVTASVAIEAEHEHEDDQAEDGQADGAQQHDEPGESHEGHEGHNEFHVTYSLDCAKLANLTSIEFDYFKSFAGAKGLTVNVVTSQSQSSYEVSRDKPVLDLSGTM
jgi:Protein of unknown function (DUF2796)